MEEREFFNETTEQRPHTLICPSAGSPANTRSPGGAPQNGRNCRATPTSATAPVREGAVLHGKTRRQIVLHQHCCRKPFEITQLQSLAFLSE